MTLPVIPGVPSPPATNPDGTPILVGEAPGSGQVTIWDSVMPKGLSRTKPIWFDIKYKPATTELESPTPHGYGATAQPVGKTVTHPGSSSQIMTDPVKIYKQIAAMQFNDPMKFIALQKLLASGPWGTVHLSGAFDTSTQKALGEALLQYTNLAGDPNQGSPGIPISFMQYITRTAETNQALGGAGSSAAANGGAGSSSGPAPLDPARIRGAAQQAAQQALGQGLSAKQLDEFVNQFTQQQLASGTSSYESNIGLPDKAMAFVQESNPQEYKQNQQQAFIDTLVNMFAPSSSQRPNMTPTPAYNPGS